MQIGLIKTFTGHADTVLDVVVHNNQIISGSADKTITLWDQTTNNSSSLEGHDIATNCVHFSHYAGIIISGGQDGTIRIWDMYNKKPIGTLVHPNIHTVGVMCVMQIGDIILAGHENGAISMWDYNLRSHICDLQGYNGTVAITSLAFYKDVSGQYAIAARADTTIKIWNIISKKLIWTLTGHTGPVTCLKVTKNLIVSGSADGNIRIWNISDHHYIATLQGTEGRVNCLAIWNNFIIAGHNNGAISIWEIETQCCEQILATDTGAVTSLDVSGNCLVSGSTDKNIRVWQIH